MNFEIIPVTRYQQNCSVLWCEKTNKAAVVDPGGDVASIVHFLDLMDLEPEVLLVTHGHHDHCGGAAHLASLTGARIEGPHIGDENLVRNLAKQTAYFAAMSDSGAPDDFRPGTGYTGLSLEDFPAVPAGKVRGYTPSRWLNHGETVRFGEEQLQVLHCPGHSEGHVAYFSEPERQAFVGDILFRGAIGAWEHPSGSLPTLLHSIRTKLFELGDDVSFVPGHGPTSTFGRERRENPFVGDEAYSKWLARAGG